MVCVGFHSIGIPSAWEHRSLFMENATPIWGFHSIGIPSAWELLSSNVYSKIKNAVSIQLGFPARGN